MKIISWNVNGIRSACNANGIKKVEKLNPDFVCLQEIKASETQLRDLKLFKKDFLFVNDALKKGYSGVAIYSKYKPKKIINTFAEKRFDEEGRFLFLEFDNFSLINLYIPHGGRQKENLEFKLNSYKLLKKIINGRKKLIIVGDFNIAHTELDLARPKANMHNIMFSAIERKQIDDIISFGFIDGFRKFHIGNGFYTWWPYLANCRGRNLGWRIDYSFVSADLSEKLVSSTILNACLGSDHCPIMLEMSL